MGDLDGRRDYRGTPLPGSVLGLNSKSKVVRLSALAVALVAVAFLSACSVSGAKNASVEEVQAAAYVAPDAPRIALYTVVNNKTGSGGHSAILISGSQQVIFDPAGSFVHEGVPRRGDVLFGITPTWERAYRSAHARSAYHVVTQDISVSAEDAEEMLSLALSNGSVAAAFCTNATSSMIRQLPGFKDVEVTFFPVNLMEQIEGRPGVTTERYYEDDEGGVLDGIPAAEL